MIPQPVFFSIVIPTYNRADLIMKTLASVFSQTYLHYEVIVVDNCSTDNTEEVLSGYIQAGKIRYLKNDRNYERSWSRNRGMENAKGDFVTFLDSDDFMYPDNLKDAAVFVGENKQCHIFHNLYELVNERSVCIYMYSFPPLTNPRKAIMAGNFFSCIGVFISRKIFVKYRFDTSAELQGMEDWEFWIRILAEYKPGRLEKVNNGILHHKGRSMTKYDLESFTSRGEYIISKIRKDPALNSCYGPYLSVFRSHCRLLTASRANSNGLFREARSYWLKGFFMRPAIVFHLGNLRIIQKALFHLEHKHGI